MSGQAEHGAFEGCVHGSELLLHGRTARALAQAGAGGCARVRNVKELARVLAGAVRNVGIARAGAWFPLARVVPGLPVDGMWAAVGADWSSRRAARAWERLASRCGGDFSRLPWWSRRPPLPPAMLLSRDAAHALGARLARTGSLERAWRAFARSGVRVVHLPEFDAEHSGSLRILEVVTTIQVGGAERVALDLVACLPRSGVEARLVVMGKPTRERYPAPAGMLDLSHVPNVPGERAEAILQAARQFGADAVHVHLLRAAEAREIRARGIPVLYHVHNSPGGWPVDFMTLGAGDVDLAVCCAQAVEVEVRHAVPAVMARTAWNGIASVPLREGPARERGSGVFTVVTIANPRAQKRLHLIPEIARAVEALMQPRAVRFVIAGEMEPHSDDSAAAIAELEQAITEHSAAALVERPGNVVDIDGLLRGADALLSVSAFEGLSLAHLEAIARGVPVVASDVGGTREIAAQSAAVSLIPADAPAGAYARALCGCEPGGGVFPKSFLRGTMAARTEWLARAAIRRASRGKGQGLWLIANNFSTGGAQTSARRLLSALREKGVRVRAAVIQEDSGHPTPGRRALEAAGIPVLAVPAAMRRPVSEAAEPLLSAIESDPSEAVFFWNVIASWKVHLADALLDMRIFDISPGEMFFSSFERFMAGPPAGLPYRELRDYGARLAGVVVKYHAEAGRAAALGCPVRVIPNGVPMRAPLERVGGPQLVLGTAARISPDKKLGELLAAVRMAQPRLPDFVLRVAGGPERDFPDHLKELKTMGAGLPIEWLGNVADMDSFLRDLDLFLMISEPAGCPNATLEAMAAGLPVVATDHGGAGEQVIDGVTGRLTPRGDAGAFADAMVEMACDAEKRLAMGAAAREHMAGNFSMEQMVRSYRSLIEGARAGGT